MVHFCVPTNLSKNTEKNLKRYKNLSKIKDCDVFLFINNLEAPYKPKNKKEILLNTDEDVKLPISTIRNLIVSYSLESFKEDDYICFLDADDSVTINGDFDYKKLTNSVYLPEMREAVSDFDKEHFFIFDSNKDYYSNLPKGKSPFWMFCSDFDNLHLHFITGILYKISFLRGLTLKFRQIFFGDFRRFSEEGYLIFETMKELDNVKDKNYTFPMIYEYHSYPSTTSLSANFTNHFEDYLKYEFSVLARFKEIYSSEDYHLVRKKQRYMIGRGLLDIKVGNLL